MRLILIFELLNAALAGALKDAVHEKHHAFLKGRETTLQNMSATMGATQAAEIIPGAYLIEFADGHVSSHQLKAPDTLLTLFQGQHELLCQLAN